MTRHMAHLVREDGAVSAFCSPDPYRPIDLRRATWTNRPEAVTCRKCLRMLMERGGRGASGARKLDA